jgi:hypothetical protein
MDKIQEEKIRHEQQGRFAAFAAGLSGSSYLKYTHPLSHANGERLRANEASNSGGDLTPLFKGLAYLIYYTGLSNFNIVKNLSKKNNSKELVNIFDSTQNGTFTNCLNTVTPLVGLFVGLYIALPSHVGLPIQTINGVMTATGTTSLLACGSLMIHNLIDKKNEVSLSRPKIMFGIVASVALATFGALYENADLQNSSINFLTISQPQATASNSPSYTHYVTANSLNVRDGAGTAFNTATSNQLLNGQCVNVQNFTNNGWAHIVLDDRRSGFIHGDHIQKRPTGHRCPN